MPKPFGRLKSLDTYALRDLPETGMGFYILRGQVDFEQYDRTLIIAGDHIVPAEEHPQLFSIKELWSREPFPQEARAGGVDLSNLRTTTSNVSLPSGYVAMSGAVPLLGSITLAGPTKFYRFIMSASDHRYHGSTLVKDTYLTTDLDHQLVNTGFGVVGRYALPIPVPASHVFEYELPAGTVLNVGTVLPNFGQSGGGVEVRTTAPVTSVQKALAKLSDW
jgi:hypothetical protein